MLSYRLNCSLFLFLFSVLTWGGEAWELKILWNGQSFELLETKRIQGQFKINRGGKSSGPASSFFWQLEDGAGKVLRSLRFSPPGELHVPLAKSGDSSAATHVLTLDSSEILLTIALDTAAKNIRFLNDPSASTRSAGSFSKADGSGASSVVELGSFSLEGK